MPIQYATVNLWTSLGRGLNRRWISISNAAYTGDTEDFLRAGRAIGAAIAATDRKVVLVASGALSHFFWPLRELRAHEASEVSHIRTARARAADTERIAWLQAGDHARVIDTMDEFLAVRARGEVRALPDDGRGAGRRCGDRAGPRVQRLRELDRDGTDASVVRPAAGRLDGPAGGSAPAEAADYIAGYTIANDFGLHDFRDTDAGSRLRVKGSDTMAPLGPGLVTGWDFRGQRLRTYVNGTLAQDGSTDEMRWDMHYLVADIARTITLYPGDVLLSGTPANSRPVQPGDVIEVEADGLGRLVNHVVAGPGPVAADYGAQPAASEEVISTALGGDWEFRGIRPPVRT